MKEKNKSGQAVSKAVSYSRPRLSGIARLCVCMACCFCMLFQTVTCESVVLAADGQASVTFWQLNDPAVFLKQSQSRVCTLTSSAMMIRRTAMLMGNEDWQQITEQSIRREAWSEGTGLKWDFTTYGITVAHKTLASKDELIRMLEQHPEGIVIYNARKPHAVLVTDYTDGVFYCSDPSNDMPVGRYPIAQASITVESASRCWYVKQPSVTVITDSEQNPDGEDPGSGTDSGQTDEVDQAGQKEPGSNGSDPNSAGPADPQDSDDKDAGSTDSEDDSKSDQESDDTEDENADDKNQDDKNQDDKNQNDNDLDPQDDKKDEEDSAVVYEVDGLTYQILNSRTRTAVCTGQSSDGKSIAVPGTVMLDETEYQVAQIANRAFANAAKLKSITIGANVSRIGTKAFYKCKKLKTVTINAVNLEEIGTNAFAHIHKKAKIYVLSDQIEGFGKLLTGTSVPGTVVVGVNQAAAKSSKAGR